MNQPEDLVGSGHLGDRFGTHEGTDFNDGESGVGHPVNQIRFLGRRRNDRFILQPIPRPHFAKSYFWRKMKAHVLVTTFSVMGLADKLCHKGDQLRAQDEDDNIHRKSDHIRNNFLDDLLNRDIR